MTTKTSVSALTPAPGTIAFQKFHINFYGMDTPAIVSTSTLKELRRAINKALAPYDRQERNVTLAMRKAANSPWPCAVFPQEESKQ